MRKLVAGLLLAVTLTGCSATSALTGLVGSKPDVSAQVGAENTKQTVGLNNKVDSSTTNKTDVQDSNVGTLDTSSKKQVQTISTGTIQAERLQVVNNDSYSLILAGLAGASIPLVFLVVILVIRKLFRKKGRQDD
ncbi:spanin [Klebsiella phage JKP2]|uniref:Spanin n=1 Tax=Klebsiella phage JKP2 TaxID=2936915 RepID=A0A9E7T6Z1_9CAUD|nr:spanin [Klebsiella phage JKP2]